MSVSCSTSTTQLRLAVCSHSSALPCDKDTHTRVTSSLSLCVFHSVKLSFCTHSLFSFTHVFLDRLSNEDVCICVCDRESIILICPFHPAIIIIIPARTTVTAQINVSTTTFLSLFVRATTKAAEDDVLVIDDVEKRSGRRASSRGGERGKWQCRYTHACARSSTTSCCT